MIATVQDGMTYACHKIHGNNKFQTFIIRFENNPIPQHKYAKTSMFKTNCRIDEHPITQTQLLDSGIDLDHTCTVIESQHSLPQLQQSSTSKETQTEAQDNQCRTISCQTDSPKLKSKKIQSRPAHASVYVQNTPSLKHRCTETDGLTQMKDSSTAVEILYSNTATQTMQAQSLEFIEKGIEARPKVQTIGMQTSTLYMTRDETKNEPLMSLLRKTITHTDSVILMYSCKTIADISESDIQNVIDSGLVTRLVELLQHADQLVLKSALQAIGNIVLGNDKQTQAVLNANFLNVLPQLLSHTDNSIQSTATWILSNITAGSINQIQEVLDAKLLHILKTSLEKGDTKTKQEAVWTITNLISGGTPVQIAAILDAGMIKPLCDLLNVETKDIKLLHNILESIQNILNTAEKAGQCKLIYTVIDNAGGIMKLKELQNHQNSEVHQTCVDVIRTLHLIESKPD